MQPTRQDFELIQINTPKLLLVMFGCLAVLLPVAFKGGDLLGVATGSTLEKSWLLGTLGIGLVCCIGLRKRRARYQPA